MRVVLSCEHGGCRVPRVHRALFVGAQRVLASHRGYDWGALALARACARRLRAPLHAVTVTRLLVDTNRSATHPRVFSEFTRTLPRAARALLLERCHAPHRRRVEHAVRGRGPVLHVGVHSFTPVFEGVVRKVDVSVLYDPARAPELRLARAWLAALRARLPELRVRANAPYRGVSDGLTTTLRRGFAAQHYQGLELEVSQRFFRGAGRADWPRVRRAILETLAELVGRR